MLVHSVWGSGLQEWVKSMFPFSPGKRWLRLATEFQIENPDAHRRVSCSCWLASGLASVSLELSIVRDAIRGGQKFMHATLLIF